MDEPSMYMNDAAGSEPAMSDPPPPAIGSDERRMHVRAYNYWVSLLGGRPYPAIADLDPVSLTDFGPHSVLLDFSDGQAGNPAIRFLGSALAAECTAGAAIGRVADVPPQSLLARLTEHHMQIIADRAPIGFEAEFTGIRGHNTLYRGILMPFSSNGSVIDYVYGVINWKELADDGITAALRREIGQALSTPPPPPPAVPLWADGPNAARSLAEPALAEPEGGRLRAELAAAREVAAAARAAEARGRAALHQAIGLAYDLAERADRCPDELDTLLAEAGVADRGGAPLAALAELVFGAGHDPARLADVAAALAHGRRRGLAAGTLASVIEGEGGLDEVVAAERRARRSSGRGAADRARDALRRAPVLSRLDLPGSDDEFVLLVARREAGSRLAVVAPVPFDAPLMDRAIRKLSS